jgi:hypothetical protein
MEPSRFFNLLNDIRGLSFDKAMLQLSWKRGGASPVVQEALKEALLKANDQSYDLSKIYIGMRITFVFWNTVYFGDEKKNSFQTNLWVKSGRLYS